MEISETTQLLLDSADGDEAALTRTFTRNSTRREPENHTLQPTAPVDEVYLKLIAVRKAGWTDQAHFYAAVLR